MSIQLYTYVPLLLTFMLISSGVTTSKNSSTFVSSNILNKHDLCEGTYRDQFTYSCANPLRILVICQNIPLPTQIGSDKRVYHVLEILMALGHSVHLAPLYTHPNTATLDDVSLVEGLNLHILNEPLFTTQTDSVSSYKYLLRAIKPNIVIMWLWFRNIDVTAPGLFIDYTREIDPAIKVVIFTDDVHSKRELQLAEQQKTKKAYRNGLKRAQKMKIAEKHIFMSADIVVATTPADKQQIIQLDATGLLARFKKVVVVRVVLSPWEQSKDSTSKIFPGYSKRKNLIFVGNGESPINFEALEWYLKDLAPEMMKGIPNVVLHCIGKSWEKFTDTHPSATKYIKFWGYLPWTEMMTKMDEARVFVSPIVASTGINTKNVLALTRGIPLVTTAPGASGLCERCDDVLTRMPYDPFNANEAPPVSEMPLLVGRNLYDFIAQVKHFYYNDNVWTEFANASKIHANNWFGKAAGARDINNMLTILSQMPHYNITIQEAKRIEKEEKERFRAKKINKNNKHKKHI